MGNRTSVCIFLIYKHLIGCRSCWIVWITHWDIHVFFLTAQGVDHVELYGSPIGMSILRFFWAASNRVQIMVNCVHRPLDTHTLGFFSYKTKFSTLSSARLISCPLHRLTHTAHVLRHRDTYTCIQDRSSCHHDVPVFYYLNIPVQPCLCHVVFMSHALDELNMQASRRKQVEMENWNKWGIWMGSKS